MVAGKKKMEGEIRTLDSSVKTDRTMLEAGSSDDAGRSLMLANAENTVYKQKREMTQDIQKQIHATDKEIRDILSDVQNTDDRLNPTQTPTNNSFPATEEKDKEKETTKERTASDNSPDAPVSDLKLAPVRPLSIDIKA